MRLVFCAFLILTSVLQASDCAKELEWTLDESRKLYGVKEWGHPYYRVGSRGNVKVYPQGWGGESIDLYELTQGLEERGFQYPIQVRFPQIVEHRMAALNEAFKKAIVRHEYSGNYSGVYPIKVNQQKDMIDAFLKGAEKYPFGLESGSKAEFLAISALAPNKETLLIANGLKDAAYIELVLFAKATGKNVVLVIDRPGELDIAISAAKKYGIQPKIGLRSKLTTKGDGPWADSSGENGKFGLNSEEILIAIEKLKQARLLESLQLIHFHLGSQLSSHEAIQRAIQEAARVYKEVKSRGAPLQMLDIGGGLAVRYDSSEESASLNSDLDAYADLVVGSLQKEFETGAPTIITESGRALSAHHSLLLFNAFDGPKGTVKHNVGSNDSALVRELAAQTGLNEEELGAWRKKISDAFVKGEIDLEQKAKGERLLRQAGHRASIYYGNFSLFQSLPDTWAIGHDFPVVPIHRLDEEPNVKCRIADLTCDSDGKLDRFYQYGKLEDSIRLHRLNSERYILGVFLTGAYQDILGDIHNLFGAPDGVDVTLDRGWVRFNHQQSSSIADVLGLVGHPSEELLSNLKESVREAEEAGRIRGDFGDAILEAYRRAFQNSPYLDPPEK